MFRKSKTFGRLGNTFFPQRHGNMSQWMVTVQAAFV